MTEEWYRYVDIAFCGGTIDVSLRSYKVIRHTPKGAWLDMRLGDFGVIGRCDKRFVLRDARKRFACPTKSEALASFRARKLRQIGIYEARARQAREALRKVEGIES